MKRIFALTLAVLVAISAGALAHSYHQGDVRVGHIWARATPAGATTAAVYAPMLNEGKEADKLLGAETAIARKVEMHQTSNDDGIMKMRKLEEIILEPNKPVTLKPGSMHLMIFGLKQSLKEGEKFPLTLRFEKAGAMKVEVAVEAAGAKPEQHKH